MNGRGRGSHAQRRRGKRGQPSRKQNKTSETEYENYDFSHAQVAKIEEQIQLPGEHSRKLGSAGKEKDISKELQTLALELGITDGSQQEIIEAACREIQNSKETTTKDQTKRTANDLEELKKVVFSVNTVKVKEHDIEKAKAKIQDLHRCQEDLTVIKTAVMNPTKRRDFKPTQSVEEVVKRIHTLHGRANEVESNLEELQKVVFSVTKAKDKEHDIEKTKAKIQDLHRCQEDLTVIKTAVMNPTKSKDFQPTQSAEEVVERINALHGCQEDLTAIKTAVMNPNKSKDFKPTQPAEEVVKIIHTLHGRANEVESNLEELQNVVFLVKKYEDKEHDIEKTKTKIQDLHRCQEDLIALKTAVMNPNKSKDFKPTQSAEEVVKRIHILHREIQNLKETTTKDKTKGGAKDLEELKKVIFSVTKVKEKDHDIEKTKTKIQDLQGCEKELITIKTAVMNPNKRKDFKPTQSAEEVEERIHSLHRCQEGLTLVKIAVMNPSKSTDFKLTQSSEKDVERIFTLHGIEDDCSELKAIKFKEELRKLALFGELDENQCTVENANKIAEELTRAADESRTEIQQQKMKLEQMEKEITELNKQLTDTRDKHQALLKRNQQLTDELKEVKSQKEKALTRLSEVAVAKLTDSNPYITDLSDPNRPEKIGEQLSELFDNLWTDVFEKLCDTCNLSERDSIQTLLQILEDSYGYCKNISSKRYSNTLAELTLWKLVEPNETPLPVPILAKIGLNVTSLSTIKKMLKSSLEGTSVIVQESFWKQRSEDPNGQKEVLECTKPFLMKCVHICWLMVGQDPPVYLRFSDKCKEKFNKNVYREYTANGNVLDFVVWPAIFLYENGPLLKKGVAQTISKK